MLNSSHSEETRGLIRIAALSKGATPNTPLLIIKLYITLLVSILVFLAVGVIGPDVFQTSETSYHSIRIDHNESVWHGKLFNMEKRHQLIWLEVVVGRPEEMSTDISFTYQQEIIVTATADSLVADKTVVTLINKEKHIKKIHCPAGKMVCDPVSIFNTHDVLYETYHLGVHFIHPGELIAGNMAEVIMVQFQMHFVNIAFTNFQFIFKAACQLITLWLAMSPVGKAFGGVLGGFFFQLSKTPKANWTDFQRWCGCLLLATFFFNDLFFPFEVYSDDGIMITASYIVFLCAYMSFMLFFWLCLMHDCSRQGKAEQDKPKGGGFYVFKGVFCSVYFMLLAFIYINIRMQQQGDPSYDKLEDTHYRIFRHLLGMCTLIYVVWFLYHFVKAAQQLKKMLPQHLFVFNLTCVVMVLSIISLISGSMYPLPTGSIGYAIIYGMLNTYVWILAWAFAPKERGSVRQQEVVGEGREDVTAMVTVGGGDSAL